MTGNFEEVFGGECPHAWLEGDGLSKQSRWKNEFKEEGLFGGDVDDAEESHFVGIDHFQQWLWSRRWGLVDRLSEFNL